MINDFPASPRDGSNSSRYNPKIIEKKMQAQTDWADLVRQQQHYAEQMIQQEKDRKSQQKAELNDVLGGLVKQKETDKRMATMTEKQQDYTHSMIRKQEYDQHLEKTKNDRLDNQRNLADNYSKQQWLREEELKRKAAQEKQMEERMISDALDSLQRENALKEKRRTDFIRSLEPLMQEKEAQKRREQERIQQEKDEHRRLMDERARNLEMQENNYKMYFQKVGQNQNNLQQVYDQNIGQSMRAKDRNIDSFIEKGIEEARRKAEQEEFARQQKKQEQLRSMKESIQNKIYENEDAKMKEKLSYTNKVDELTRQNQQMQDFNEQQKRDRVRQTMDYKSYLQSQMKETEDQRRNYNSNMLEQEKKMHSNFDGLIPGIRSSKVDAQMYGHTRSAKNLSMLNPEASSPYNDSPYGSSPYTNRSYKPDNITSSVQSVRNSSGYNPFNMHNQDRYNPITNPIPNTVQNPYLAQRDGYQSKNVLASVANKNLLA